MIYNIILLLAANVIIPLGWIPAGLFAAYNYYDFPGQQSTVYNDMNLTRIYTQDQFKKSFRDSLKRLHPDRGGKQEDFQRVKQLKQIMEKPINYYDLYNLTNLDLTGNQSLKEVVELKSILYLFQTIIFYFIAILYILAFTIDDQIKRSRWILIFLTALFVCWEFMTIASPKETTIIDRINDKIPIFVQTAILKRIFCLLCAIIRTYYLKKKNQETVLVSQIRNLPEIQENQLNLQADNSNIGQLYISSLKKLSELYQKKVQNQELMKKSWQTKIRNWFSKGVSFIFIGLMLWGVVSNYFYGQTGNQNQWMQSQF